MCICRFLVQGQDGEKEFESEAGLQPSAGTGTRRSRAVRDKGMGAVLGVNRRQLQWLPKELILPFSGREVTAAASGILPSGEKRFAQAS